MVKKTAFLLLGFSALNLGLTLQQNMPPPLGFAVIELFTSEGCSSCPPADALIARIEKENKQKPVYILCYHVDYWNRLGWKDRFSNVQNSKRQNRYADWLKLSNIYTPQIVVNGSEEFIGSDEKALRDALQKALKQTIPRPLEIVLERQTGSTISLNYQTGQQVESDNLFVAIVEPNATNRIERGENKGKTLHHVQIVNSFETFSLNGKQKGSVKLALGNVKNGFKLIAFLQNAQSGTITAAGNLPLDGN